MINKKYQVFISSTYTDLIEERRKVMDVLLMADCIPAGMEAFVATDNEQFEVIKKVIDLCDYYVLILGLRYGSVSPITGKSYTEMEYEYAKEKGIPVLVFAIDEDIEVDESKRECEEEKVIKLKHFREKALTNRMASIWKNDGDLKSQVAISIMQAKQELSRPGWRRGSDYDEADLLKKIVDLTDLNNELEEKLQNAQKLIQELTLTDDLAFEECEYNIRYYYYETVRTGVSPRREKRDRHTSISLDKIFLAVAIEMLDVTISEWAIGKVIKNLISHDHDIYFDDSQFVKRVLGQLQGIGLIQSKWNEKKGVLFWGLTEKGVKTRNDMLLIKGDKN